ncbi:MAG: hypothetical protein CMP22_07625 [Rickettsiales bacterium]|nr:hypothetical protein [Rickettsiales bacterium]|tara:strand:- start:1186 stop:1467 length:282 start_codon:yes stop_codon:yes gene_type:complete
MTTNKEELSIEAKVVWGALFQFGTTHLTFNTPSKIHPRTKKGLDELVENKYLKFEDVYGVYEYKRLDKDMPRISRKELKENSFPITEHKKNCV